MVFVQFPDNTMYMYMQVQNTAATLLKECDKSCHTINVVIILSQFIDYTMYCSNGKFPLFWIEVSVEGYIVLTTILSRQARAVMSCGLNLLWAPDASSFSPMRYIPIGSVPSHHSKTPLHWDNGIT